MISVSLLPRRLLLKLFLLLPQVGDLLVLGFELLPRLGQLLGRLRLKGVKLMRKDSR